MNSLIIIIIVLFLSNYYQSVQSVDKCGNSKNSYYIVGGQTARPLSWPWMAFISTETRELASNKTYSFRCGGTLINDRWVLTAAHCVEEDAGQQIYQIKVQLGKHNISLKESFQLDLQSVKNIKHEKYDKSKSENDIALIKLNQTLDLMGKHQYLEPICLPKFNQIVNESNCYATGWGTTAFNGLLADVLQEVRLPIMNNTYCREATNNKVIKYNADLMLCAGYEEGGKSTCGGDSGGPLVCPTSNHIWIQYGITSFGFQCGLKGNPMYFTRVSHYVDWIENNIQN